MTKVAASVCLIGLMISTTANAHHPGGRWKYNWCGADFHDFRRHSRTGTRRIRPMVRVRSAERVE